MGVRAMFTICSGELVSVVVLLTGVGTVAVVAVLVVVVETGVGSVVSFSGKESGPEHG